jgi:hypothetical protein
VGRKSIDVFGCLTKTSDLEDRVKGLDFGNAGADSLSSLMWRPSEGILLALKRVPAGTPAPSVSHFDLPAVYTA